MWAEGEELVWQWWVTWMSGPPAYDSSSWPLALLMSHPGCSTSILWWISLRSAGSYDLVGQTEPRFSWATWSLDVPWLSTPSQPGPITMPGALFSNGIWFSAADGMAWLQNPRVLHCESPTGLVINSTWHLFPPQITLVAEGLLVIWSKQHHNLDLTQSSFLTWVPL